LSGSARLRLWQIGTLGLLTVGYAGYYLCRSNLSVVTPLLIDELHSQGIETADARVQLGTLVSLGTLAYALGKFCSGAVGDLLGGRSNFLGGMAGAVVCTVLFALAGGFPLFTLAWVANRLVQSFGWSGMVKIAGRWFDYTAHGTIMAVLSLSYLFGDAAARAFMGFLIGQHLGWRDVFFVNAGVLAGLLAVSLLLLKGSPREIGAAEGKANPLNLYGAAGGSASPGLVALVVPLLRSPAFWFACLLSLALTFLRETFNNWTPLYFKEAIRLEADTAAYLSAAFSFLGGCSVLLAGLLSDHLGRTGRAAIICIGMLLTAAALAILSLQSDDVGAVGLVLLTGFLLLGPYSYLAGAISLDFGGQRGGATACGIIDGVGYLGGVLAGDSLARLVRAGGWSAAFGVLSAVAFVAFLVAGLFWHNQARLAREANG
jgi:OPA family glycerol-3-phosphate transporter-like MFS transporter